MCDTSSARVLHYYNQKVSLKSQPYDSWTVPKLHIWPQMMEEEQYDTTMDKVLDFAAASFERLLPKIEIGEVSNKKWLKNSISKLFLYS